MKTTKKKKKKQRQKEKRKPQGHRVGVQWESILKDCDAWDENEESGMQEDHQRGPCIRYCRWPLSSLKYLPKSTNGKGLWEGTHSNWG